ncbi:hypothetical protein V6N13_014586 [Hibiscus sabdariffa]
MQRTSSTLAPGADGHDEAGTCSTNVASPTHAVGPDEAVMCSTNDPTALAAHDQQDNKVAAALVAFDNHGQQVDGHGNRTWCNIGVFECPPENIFIFGQSSTITVCKDGNPKR